MSQRPHASCLWEDGYPLPPEISMSTLDLNTHTRARLPLSALTVLVALGAVLANLGLYTGARLLGASMRIDPYGSTPNHLVIGGDVAWKTAAPLLLGVGLLAITGTRWPRLTTAGILLGAAVAVGTSPVVFTGSHDAVTGAALAGMHLLTGAAYVGIGMRIRARARGGS